jgi:hypothetical protein
MPAPEETRGLLRGSAVAFTLLVLVPAVVVFWPYGAPSATQRDIPIQGLLFLLFYGPVYFFLWVWEMPWVARVVFTVLEIGLLVGIFGWLCRKRQLRVQVLYALVSFGAYVAFSAILVAAAGW